MQTKQTVSQQKQILSQEFGEWGQESNIESRKGPYKIAKEGSVKNS